jgi:predicted outer membrane protein
MKRTNEARVAGIAVLTLAFAACSTQRPAPRPVTPAPPAPPATRPLDRAASPAQFVARAASIDLFVVRACDLARARSAERRVRAVAERLAEEHRGLAAQLSMAGRWIDTLPGARLLAREEQRLGSVEAGPAFDAAFLEQMRAAHRQSLALHAAFAARGSSPTLRPVAANGAAVERRHLGLLSAL